ncbi:MAG: hypothetical protein O7H41_19435, partial [Planctomycetota bacterium]|nr:hypothetical protein [Planctomycetota bacterium]
LSGDGGFGGLSPRGLRLSAKDKGRISLAVHDWPTLTMFRSEDTAGIWMFVTEESSSLSMTDGSFQDRARLEVPHPTTAETGEETEAPPPSLIFSDKEGDVIWEAP